MTPNLYILCIEDEPEVREAIQRDLQPLSPPFLIEGFASAEEARQWISALHPRTDRVALILCDHVMPGQRGVAFLTSLKQAVPESVEGARKVLFTGQAGHEDTIEAINNAGIHHYQPKPWDCDGLLRVLRELLTDYILLRGIQPLPYMTVLNAQRLAQAVHDHNLCEDI